MKASVSFDFSSHCYKFLVTSGRAALASQKIACILQESPAVHVVMSESEQRC